jgi:5-methyltetrahydrofolate--homocysteine methyltransferase
MFEALVEALSTVDREKSVAEVKRLIAAGVDPFAIVEEGLMQGMEIVGENFEAGKYFLPELLLAGKTVEACSAIVKPLLAADQLAAKGNVVVGTVAGDIHDLGKNIVISTLESAGYRVTDVGVDVPVAGFLRAIRREKASVLALSTLLTVTMVEMEQVIAALREDPELAGVKVVVGGAPLDEEYARRIGADGYGKDARDALRKVRELMEG